MLLLWNIGGMVLFTIGLCWLLMVDWSGDGKKYIWFVYEDNVVVYAHTDLLEATRWAKEADIKNPIIIKSADRRNDAR